MKLQYGPQANAGTIKHAFQKDFFLIVTLYTGKPVYQAAAWQELLGDAATFCTGSVHHLQGYHRYKGGGRGVCTTTGWCVTAVLVAQYHPAWLLF